MVLVLVIWLIICCLFSDLKLNLIKLVFFNAEKLILFRSVILRDFTRSINTFYILLFKFLLRIILRIKLIINRIMQLQIMLEMFYRKIFFFILIFFLNNGDFPIKINKIVLVILWCSKWFWMCLIHKFSWLVPLN